MSTFQRLQWKSTSSASGAVASAVAAVPSGLCSLLGTADVVDFPVNATPKDKAVILLHAAAEVEHQFVVQYLYAYYCGGRQFGDLLSVAKEEMGHLLTVQNLLAILGEPPYLGRMDPPADLQPSPFKLEPLNIGFAARFLIAESSVNASLPDDIDRHLPNGLTHEKIHHVGAIYAMLYWLFQDERSPSGPWMVPLGADLSELKSLGHLSDNDLADPTAVQNALSVAADWDAVDAIANPDVDVLVLPKADFTQRATMRAAALSAIHMVSGQGEGPEDLPQGMPEQTHAQRLGKIYDALLKTPSVTLPFPTDPYTSENTAHPEDPNALISREPARTDANTFDRIYETLLLTIASSVTAPASDVRRKAAQNAIGIMHRLAASARALVTLPRKDGDDTLMAAPPFTFPAHGIPAEYDEIQTRLQALANH